jgi:hypothetical protein
MNALARTGILAATLAGIAASAYFLVQSGLAQLVFRGNLEPGSQAFWLSLLLAVTAMIVIADRGAQTRPASVEAPRPLALVTPARPAKSAHRKRSRAQVEQRRAA